MPINTSNDETPSLRIALIGAGFMARSHTLAYGMIQTLFPELGYKAELEILADASPELAKQGAERLGYSRWTSEWRDAVTDPAVDIVDIVTPNWLHFEVAMAAIEAGKHVYCEKPLAITASEAKQMWEAAEKAGVKTIVGFSYLGNPGIQFAKQLVETGELGDIWSIKAHFNVDANADSSLPRTWHYERAKAGLGALGDIGSHVISIIHNLVGPIDQVFGELTTAVKKRPEAVGASSYGSKAAEGAPLLPVENDDFATVLGRLASGGKALIEANRVANGHPFDLGFEITGSKGSIIFDQQTNYKVELFIRGKQPEKFVGTTTVQLGPNHPNYISFWPFPGVTLGLHEQKALEIRNLFQAIVDDTEADPNFREGWRVAEVLEASEKSYQEGKWVTVPQ